MKTGSAFARGMRLLRKRLGITQAQLAEAAGLHEQFVSQLEREERSPAIETIDAISGALGAEPWELLKAGALSKNKPAAPDPVGHVRALLAAWPEDDQARLVKLLIELRQVAASTKESGSANRRPPGKSKRR